MIVVLNNRQFGKNLRFLRRRHHYSRWELANLICSYPKVIRDWETGRSFDVDSVCMLNIGKLFGIPIESLIDDDLRRIYKSRKCPPLLFSSGGIAYLTKDVLKLQLQLSPGSRMAAAGFSSQRMEPPSGLGRLCHGSMHTNFGSPPGIDQISV